MEKDSLLGFLDTANSLFGCPGGCARFCCGRGILISSGNKEVTLTVTHAPLQISGPCLACHFSKGHTGVWLYPVLPQGQCWALNNGGFSWQPVFGSTVQFQTQCGGNRYNQSA